MKNNIIRLFNLEPDGVAEFEVSTIGGGIRVKVMKQFDDKSEEYRLLKRYFNDTKKGGSATPPLHPIC